MKKMTNWEELEWRGLVKDVEGSDIADKINNDLPERVFEYNTEELSKYE